MQRTSTKVLKFLVVFAATALAAYIAASFLFAQAFAALAAYSSQAFLLFLGVPTIISFQQNPHLVSAFFDAELVDLCWGLVEIAIILGVILASEDRTIKQRVYGALLGVLVVLAFNAVRIAVTLKLFNPSQPFASAFAHDLLFRLSLLIVITGYYALWYLFLTSNAYQPKTRS